MNTPSSPEIHKTVRVKLSQQKNYAFLVDFGDDIDPLLTDESPPLGEGAGPNPAQLLLTSLANCLAASLTFSLRKFHNEPGPIEAEVEADIVRDERGRWRIPAARVILKLADNPADLRQFERILEQFEDFCIVTQSVRAGMAVSVSVRDAAGRAVPGLA